MPVPGPNAANRTPFEGSFELNDLDKTEENRALVQKFVKRCLVLGDLSNLERFLSKTLIQHSPGMADGTAAFVDYFRRQQWLAQAIVYGDVRHIVAEGNFVTTISQGSIGGVPHALWDLWRVQDGIIEEQWSLRTEIKVSALHTNPMV
jgi:predicted SnoaL-like aldol condensation-catalyzing enzyme